MLSSKTDILNAAHLGAGKGVECTLTEAGQRSSVRFGSLDFIQESLPSSQAPRIQSMAGGLGSSSVVSVLVKSPAQEQRSSPPDSSMLLRCCEPSKKRCISSLLDQVPLDILR